MHAKSDLLQVALQWLGTRDLLGLLLAASARSSSRYDLFTKLNHNPARRREQAQLGLATMQSVVEDARPEGPPERGMHLLIEKGFLLLGSIEHQLEDHLMSHGTRIDPETRFFMAQVRDAAGDAAAKMLDEARSQLETATGAEGSDGADSDAPKEERVNASLLPTEIGCATATGGDRKRTSWCAAANVGLGTAAAALVAALLITDSKPSATPEDLAGIADGADAEPRTALTTAYEAIADKWETAVAIPTIQAGDRTTELPSDVSTSSLAGPVLEFGVAGSDVVDYRQLAETLALALHTTKLGEQPPYPDPRAWPEQTVPSGEWSPAKEERSLALSAGDRLEVQRRLALARFDPRHFDGIFGPATRVALSEWQRSAGIAATGYLNAPALALIRDQTADDYRARQAANKARARQQATRMVLTSPIPRVSPFRADGCSRTRTGKIVYGRGVRCDFRGLRQNIARLFG